MVRETIIIEKVVRWVCDVCLSIHQFREAAEECCRPKVRRIDVYICPICRMEHEDEQIALKCCSYFECVCPACGEPLMDRNYPSERSGMCPNFNCDRFGLTTAGEMEVFYP